MNEDPSSHTGPRTDARLEKPRGFRAGFEGDASERVGHESRSVRRDAEVYGIDAVDSR
jgi:hypothetical protein